MSKRRDALRAMMAPIAIPAASEERMPRTPAKSGSLKAMGLSLQSLSDDADEARSLREQLASGANVVELDPDLIDPSFVRDRLDDPAGEAFEAFKQSLAEGQQVPILVRPRPDAAGRFQAAYGHRRLAALRELGLPVKAIVRHLSDEELVIAQGKENNDRRDLSFIERALFASRLEDRGFTRLTLTSALFVHKGNLSTMIAVVRSIPEELIVAIGPAPKIGRPRWEQLAERIERGADGWRKEIENSNFETLNSDARFERVLKSVNEIFPKKTDLQIVRSKDGSAVARVHQNKHGVRFEIDRQVEPAFGTYLIDQLPEIYASFRRRSDA